MASSLSQSSGPVKVVAVFHGADRQVVKGFVFDFSPLRDKCRIFPSEAARAHPKSPVILENPRAKTG